jgi:hypothetical protein
MSLRAITLVRERARAKGSDRLVLFGIADVAHDDGREAFPTTLFLVQWSKLTDRNVRLVLHRLERQGEIVIEPNADGRTFTRRDGSVFAPKWYLHIRCICDWEAYQAAKEPEKISGSLPVGRPRKPEKISGSRAGKPEKISGFPGTPATETGNLGYENRKNQVRKPEKSGIAYKERSVTDPSLNVVQGAPPPAAPVEAVEKSPATEPAGDHLAVITKIAHEAIDLLGVRADLGELAEAVKSRCAQLHIVPALDGVRKAIDSALFQRRRQGVG